MSDEYLEVDPDLLRRMADPYHVKAAEFARLQERVRQIHVQYRDAWGHDEMGNRFGAGYTKGLYDAEDRVESFRTRMMFLGDSLKNGAKLFANTDDDAYKTTADLHTRMQRLDTQPPASGSTGSGGRATPLKPMLPAQAATSAGGVATPPISAVPAVEATTGPEEEPTPETLSLLIPEVPAVTALLRPTDR